MKTRNLFASTLAASLLSAVTALSSAQAGQPQTCVFEKYAPVAVQPYITDNSIDYGSYSYLGGAQLFVPAREGLTKEWLTASVQQVFGQATSEPDRTQSSACQGPRVSDVGVSVVSAGNGFWVQLIGRDYRSSQTLLQWAKSVVAQHKPVRTASRQ